MKSDKRKRARRKVPPLVGASFRKLAKTFGKADPATQAHREAVRKAGFAVEFHHGMTNAEALAVLRSPEMRRILRSTNAPAEARSRLGPDVGPCCPKCGKETLSVEEDQGQNCMYAIECQDCGWRDGRLWLTYDQALSCLRPNRWLDATAKSATSPTSATHEKETR